jgi:hypothetical protein
LVDTVDITTCWPTFGFAPRTAFVSELAGALRTKLLPGSPETIDASELFVLALPMLSTRSGWRTGRSHAEPPGSPAGAAGPSGRHRAGSTRCSTPSPTARGRSSRPALPRTAPAHERIGARSPALPCADPRRGEPARGSAARLRTPDRLNEAAQRLRERLEACRAAAATVYTHFEDNGISVGLVFRLRQLRERIVRVRELLDCLLSPKPAVTAACLSHLVQVGQERRSLRALFASNSSLLAAKVAERSAETGEHYITRTPAEYRSMVHKAAGGGAGDGLHHAGQVWPCTPWRCRPSGAASGRG